VTAAFQDVSFGQFFIIVAIAAGLSLLVFRHASKRGSKHATAWGIAVFLAAGIFVPAYFIHYFLTKRRK
jgi:hypothetical protein